VVGVIIILIENSHCFRLQRYLEMITKTMWFQVFIGERIQNQERYAPPPLREAFLMLSFTH